MTSGKFSLQWVNNTANSRAMTSVVFTLREPQMGVLSTAGGSQGLGTGGLTCEALHLDQVHIIFRPSDRIAVGEFRSGDSADLRWRAETNELCVRLTPGERHVLYTRGASASSNQDTNVSQPQRSLIFSTALAPMPYTGAIEEDFWCRSYRPVRDMPVARYLQNVSEISIDLLWPLLHGDPNAAWWSVPDYRILRVTCDFSYH